MLKSLSIVNYALIENLQIDFENGFSVITGETGAGKSIIIGALSLILGNRADSTVLRNKNQKCIIEGVFDNGSLNLRDFFEENDLDYDGNTILRRELLPSGKTRAFINDTPVTLKVLSSLGNRFVNIHSQHQTLQLSDASFQLSVLDDYFIDPKLLEDYKNLYYKYKQYESNLQSLIETNEKAIRDEDYFRFQYNELANAKLDVDAFSELEEKASLLEHSEEIKIALSESEYLISDSETSLQDNLQLLIKSLEKVSNYLPKTGSLLERLNSILIELDDIRDEVFSLNNYDDFDPAELQRINERINLVYTLFKKHNVDRIDELIEIRDQFDEKLQSLDNLENDIADARKDLEDLELVISKKSDKLHSLRIKGAKKFGASVENVLLQLGMKDAEFNVQVDTLDKFTNSGRDAVLFMFNANKGGEPGEIGKIASGGELSRLMLAIKSLITQKQLLPTVIFDEIDSGVSGDIAGKVGSIMKSMSKVHQIIAITHLPQIAAKSDYHYKVYKTSTKDITRTTIDKLDNEAKVEEIATMMSSDSITEKVIEVAREMIDNQL